MGRLLYADNPSTYGLPFTRIDADISSGNDTITVENSNGFSAGDFIVIGEIGKENTEIAKINAITDETTIVLTANLDFDYVIDDPVALITADKIKFYGSTTLPIETTDILSTVDIDVNMKSRNTLYNHSDGDSTWYYKYTFYNSESAVETSLSDAELIEGDTVDEIYCTEEDVLDLLDLSQADDNIPTPSLLLSLILSRSRLLDSETLSSFKENTFTSDDYIYIDGRGRYKRWYFLGKAPIISITKLEITMSKPGDTATWTELTSGRDNDYILDSERGMVYLTSDINYPIEYPNSIRWYGVWGRESIPEDVRWTVAKGVVLDLARSSYYRSLVVGNNQDVNSIALRDYKNDWKDTVKRYKVYRFINT